MIFNGRIMAVYGNFTTGDGNIEAQLDEIIAIQEELIGTIEFYIEGIEYQAEEGMTWEAWCDSEYNTGNYICQGNRVGWYIDDEWWWIVDAEPSALIIAGHDYSDVGS